VYERGAFSGEAVKQTAIALVGYGVSTVFLSYRELFSRLHYSYKDSKRPMINSVIGICLNILLSIILSRYMGILGVTLASSVSTIISAILNMISSKKHNRFIKLSLVCRNIPFWVLGGLMCVATTWLIGIWMSNEHALIRLIVSVVASMAVYVVACMPIILKVLRTIKNKRHNTMKDSNE